MTGERDLSAASGIDLGVGKNSSCGTWDRAVVVVTEVQGHNLVPRNANQIFLKKPSASPSPAQLL